MLRRATLAALAGLALPAWAQPSQFLDNLAKELENSKNPIFLGRKPLPLQDPAWGEVAKLLSDAPADSSTPYKVAKYLDSAIPDRYQQAWPEEYANPLVMQMFMATKTKPEGDTTPWCAAFANWCLNRAGVPGTGRADAVSFKKWGTAVWERTDGSPLPDTLKEGDIAVFQWSSKPAHGHVAFVVGINRRFPNRLDILGGNQIKAGVHRIQVDSFKTEGDLKLVAIRTAPGLHSA